MATSPNVYTNPNDPTRGHTEERAQIGGLTAATASKADAFLIRSFITPLEVWNKVVATGVAKSKFSWPKKILLSFLAGCYLSFGMAFAFLVGGQLNAIKVNDPGLFNLIYGFFGLPFGLTMIILMGADLFTSDVTFLLAAWVEGKVAAVSIYWNLIWCWFGNLCGSLWMSQMFLWAEVYDGREAFETSTLVKKTSFNFGVTLARGIMCNWLVNIGVWQAMTAQDVAGKFVGVFIPVTIFVVAGFEHCIANQYALSIGHRLGGPVSVNDIIVKNLIPATLGNIIAAGVFIVLFYYLSIGSGHDKLVNWWNETMARLLPPYLADLMQTGDYAPDGSAPLPGKFIGDVSMHGYNDASRHGFSGAVARLTASFKNKNPAPGQPSIKETNGKDGNNAA